MSAPTSRSLGRRRATLTARLATALIAALAVVCEGCSAPAPAPPPLPGPSRLSLFALGDAGIPPRLHGLFSKQVAVGRGMTAEARRTPVDGIVLLGDNFYDEGLFEPELVERVRENVVRPYCAVLALDGPRSAEVADACPVPAAERHPVPLHVVFGNHDYKSEEGPQLEIEAVPRFVPGWSVGHRPVEVRTVAPGVDLVLFDSDLLSKSGDTDPLRAALAATRGPWRILAAHHPIAYADGEDRNPQGEEARYTEAVRKVILEVGLPVQLFLSGHVHNLQLLEGAAPLPGLHVIAGAGGRPKPVRYAPAHRLFAIEAPGFVRIDLAGAGGDERLFASVFTTSSFPLLAGAQPRLEARYSVDVAGRVRNELTAP